MDHIPAQLRYAETHEWVRDEGDGTVTVGITHHAQNVLGDLVYVEPPAAGRQLQAGEPCAAVESVKAASDVYSPLAGEVTAGNEALADAPELINEDPYGDGWILRLKPADPAALSGLLDAAAYAALLAGDED